MDYRKLETRMALPTENDDVYNNKKTVNGRS